MGDEAVFWAPTDTDEAGIYAQLREAAIEDNATRVDELAQHMIKLDSLHREDSGGRGTTALHEAAGHGSVHALERLIAHGATVDVYDFDPNNQFEDNTPLYWAALHAQPECVRALLKTGADPRLLGIRDNTPFAAVLSKNCAAAGLGAPRKPDERQIATIKAFVEHGIDLNDRENFEDATVTEQAAILGDLDLLQYLLDHGASADGLLPLSAGYHGDGKVLHFLLNKGSRDSDGAALYQAALRNQMPSIDTLIALPESLSAGGSGGALHVASEKGYTKIAEKILRNGISPDSRDKDGLTPLLRVCMLNRVELSSLILLLDHGADINLQAKSEITNKCVVGDTALHVATRYCLGDILKLLLERGADANKKNGRGQNPLNKLAEAIAGPIILPTTRTARILGIKLLLNAGAQADEADNDGNTAINLLLAHQSGSSDELILEAIQLLKGS